MWIYKNVVMYCLRKIYVMWYVEVVKNFGVCIPGITPRHILVLGVCPLPPPSHSYHADRYI